MSLKKHWRKVDPQIVRDLTGIDYKTRSRMSGVVFLFSRNFTITFLAKSLFGRHFATGVANDPCEMAFLLDGLI